MCMLLLHASISSHLDGIYVVVRMYLNALMFAMSFLSHVLHHNQGRKGLKYTKKAKALLVVWVGEHKYVSHNHRTCMSE